MHRVESRTRTFIFAILGCALIVGFAAPVFAADIYVDTTLDQYWGNCIIRCSLRDAILISNSNGQADTIHVPAGHYSLTIPNGPSPSGEAGDLFIDSPDAVTIIGEGPGVTIVDGNAIDRVFRIDAGGTGNVVLQGMTITGGSTGGSGGGVFNWDATLFIRSCEITGNHVTATSSREGGGIYNGAGILWINDSVISYNTSSRQAGGVYSGEGSTTQFVRCAVNNNTAGTSGGGMYSEGDSYFNNVTFWDNDAGGSADGVLVEGTSEFLHCTFAQRLASDEAIFARAGGALATLKNSIIVGACNVEVGTIDAVAGNVEYGDTCLMEYGNYYNAGSAAGLGSITNFGFNGGGVPTWKLQEGSVSHDYVFTTNNLYFEDARMSPRPMGVYGDSGAYESVAGEIFRHGFENRYTTGWSSTVQ